MSQCFCLFFFSDSAISFFFPLFSYIIWSWVNLFACSFLLFSYFFFSCSSFSYIIWSRVNLFAYSFSRIYIFLFLSFNFIYNIKSSQSFGLFIFYHSAISFSCVSSSYCIGSWVKVLAYSFFIIQLFLFPILHLYI